MSAPKQSSHTDFSQEQKIRGDKWTIHIKMSGTLRTLKAGVATNITRDAFPQENANVIAPQQQSAIAYFKLCNYVDANVSLSYHLLDEQ